MSIVILEWDANAWTLCPHLYIGPSNQKSKARNKDMHMTFIDLERAYDNVPRSQL